MSAAPTGRLESTRSVRNRDEAPGPDSVLARAAGLEENRHMKTTYISAALAGFYLLGFAQGGEKMSTKAYATFGAGCFWCTEAVFEGVPGVVSVESGYSGGTKKNPTYKEVCTGTTGHAEVVRVEFDPEKVTYKSLLDLFWRMHDPTTLNRQGADVGTQYRSIIFYHSDEQKREAEEAKKELEKAGTYGRPIVTRIEKAGPFYPAEGYHQDYFRNNATAPYCRRVIAPKLEKLHKKP
jgi:peptide-methionine (S)-S-oxide reductase